ncbi:pectin lyase-like protein [Paraphaeosphaeria sporulosa]|uniref:Pectin lyase-like protein n=1 Tax=Paraphaeosphaeria sporulosa TaxID=1460663 RepID=A0A177C6H5_9PLEO|nr:pectin lyase-like protein [Paraphaeosphaeria sporulosa]OAG03135.1 pectin lyase-like protein [Paraphaeosphaeria sporulosa]
MRSFSLCSSALALFALPALAGPSADNTCTPLANGFAAIDDSPAINAALVECGAGGTIVLPADQAYSIFTPLDFSLCRHCDVQIEGTLILAAEQLPYYGTLPYYANGATRSVFTIANATGVRIRSVTGSGVVDGNAVSWYQRTKWSPKTGGYPFVHVTNGSTDVSVENLHFKNIQDRVFRLQGGSSNLRFEDVRITAEGINPNYASFDNFAFEMGKVENVSIANVDIDFGAQTGSDRPVGTCVSFDHGTDGVAVANVTCRRAFMGAAIQFDTISAFAPSAANATATVSNILVSNFTFAGAHATGVESWFNLSKKVIRNAVWEWVTVEGGTPAEFDPCYASMRDTQYYPRCLQYATYDAEVVFRHYRGKVGSPPTDPRWGEVNGLMDVRPVFEDWVADA